MIEGSGSGSIPLTNGSGSWTPSYDTKMLLTVVFDKTASVKFKISNNFKWNIDGTNSKQQQQKIQRKIHTSLWILKIRRKKSANQKSWDSCKMFVIFKMKTIPAFVKFKISNNFQRNIDGPNSKQLKIQRNLKKKIYEPKSLETIAKCLWFSKENHEGMVQSSLWIFILSDFHLRICKFRVETYQKSGHKRLLNWISMSELMLPSCSPAKHVGGGGGGRWVAQGKAFK